jgi:hypothetical protein
MVPRDRIARPARRASTCRSTDELPRRGAGGGTRTPGDPRSAAACLRCSATPARRATQVQGPGLEPGIFAFRARRGTDSTIPVRACGRRSHSVHVRVHVHGDSISVSNLDIRGVKGRGPSSTDLLIGGDSLVGQKKRAWSWTRPSDVGGWLSSLRRVVSSHLPGLAARTRLDLKIRMRIRRVPAHTCPRVHGQRCCERADGSADHDRKCSRHRSSLQAPVTGS